MKLTGLWTWWKSRVIEYVQINGCCNICLVLNFASSFWVCACCFTYTWSNYPNCTLIHIDKKEQASGWDWGCLMQSHFRECMPMLANPWNQTGNELTGTLHVPPLNVVWAPKVPPWPQPVVLSIPSQGQTPICSCVCWKVICMGFKWQ